MRKLSSLKKIGILKKKFPNLESGRLRGFFLYLPIKYEDQTRIIPISHANPGEFIQIQGYISSVNLKLFPKYRLSAVISDHSGKILLRWFSFNSNQKRIRVGKKVRVRGEVCRSFFQKEIIHPIIVDAEAPLPKTLTPIYQSVQGISQDLIRKAVLSSMREDKLTDTLPNPVLMHFNLMKFDAAIKLLHSPSPKICKNSLVNRKHPAWKRIKFDEILARLLSLEKIKLNRYKKKAYPLGNLDDSKSLQIHFQETLPFQLTNAQKKAIGEILTDLRNSYPMYRLLQGDVGSGKTIVAAIAAIQAIHSNTQVALMVPTELLAQQHFQKLSEWLEPLGVHLGFLSGNLTSRKKDLILRDILSGEIKFVIGTQALIQKGVQFKNLGLSIVDEQHRFGVNQRLALGFKRQCNSYAKNNIMPHQLVMSATPIPRTLAMTLFADMDISIIDESPPRRSITKTKVISNTRRNELLSRIACAVKNGRQAYWVFPAVHENENLSLNAAVDFYQDVSNSLPGLNIALLHGKLPSKEKTEIMDSFQKGKVGLLIASTVIETGIDVTNASLMVIEHAERFGLAQLHQLRGRVGRGSDKSICFLLYHSPLSHIARERLKIMFETNDGFKIASKDLQQRGPGEFLGIRQSGMQDLCFFTHKEDLNLIKDARAAAFWIIKEYPEMIQKHLSRWLQILNY